VEDLDVEARTQLLEGSHVRDKPRDRSRWRGRVFTRPLQSSPGSEVLHLVNLKLAECTVPSISLTVSWRQPVHDLSVFQT
jgi:hypothetical protein